MKLQITCKQATEFIVKRDEGKLSLKGRLQLWLHMGVCGFCKLFALQTKLIAKNSRHMHEHITDTLTDKDKEAIVASLQQQG